MITLRQVSERDLSEQTLSDRTIRELADWTISSKTAELLLKQYQTEVWSGEAVVHVSIVNWVKGTEVGPKQLFIQKAITATVRGNSIRWSGLTAHCLRGST